MITLVKLIGMPFVIVRTKLVSPRYLVAIDPVPAGYLLSAYEYIRDRFQKQVDFLPNEIEDGGCSYDALGFHDTNLVSLLLLEFPCRTELTEENQPWN